MPVSLQEVDESCLYIIYPGKLNSILEGGYQLQKQHSVKDKRGIEFFKIGELKRES